MTENKPTQYYNWVRYIISVAILSMYKCNKIYGHLNVNT